MHRNFPPTLVFTVSVNLVGHELNIVRVTPQERSPAIVFAREAITGAMRDMTHPRPSWPEIAVYFGTKRHNTPLAFYGRFQRWFPRLRAAWLDMVRDACEAPASDYEPQLTITPPWSMVGDKPLPIGNTNVDMQ